MTASKALSTKAGGYEAYAKCLKGETAVIGRQGAISLEAERFCHPREAEINWKQGRIWLNDLEEGNGVFLRIRQPVELEIGDADQDVADDRIAGQIGDEREARHEACRRSRRVDERGDLGVAERVVVEPPDRVDIGRGLGSDPETGRCQEAVPAVASRSASGSGRRCSTG